MAPPSRRAFLKGAGAVAAAVVMPACDRDGTGKTHALTETVQYKFFTADEARIIEAAVSRLIPADETGPGAIEADVPRFMDRQLAGSWGTGDGLYRSGPWQAGKPEQGYQLQLTPADLFRTALRGIAEDLRKRGSESLARLKPDEQDAYLRSLETNSHDLAGVPSDVFFKSLLELTIEGFFADPVYGGNKDMVGWKLVGFPGAYANFYEFVDQHGIAFNRPPMSIGQDPSGTAHAHADGRS